MRKGWLSFHDRKWLTLKRPLTEVLYVNINHHHDLAQKYELKYIDPFNILKIAYIKENPERLSELFVEASRIMHEDPLNFGAAKILSSILIIRGQQELAIHYANNIIKNYPDNSYGYALKADAFWGMKNYTEAKRFYKRALDIGQTGQNEAIYRNLHTSYIKLKEYENAYKLLSQYVNPFNEHVDYKDIYELGMSAACVDRFSEATLLLQIAKISVPPHDTEYAKRIDNGLSMVEAIMK